MVPPLAPGTDTTALARPLPPPTTTFSIVASVPHFSVSLLTLSFSTWGAPLYFTSASMVPPPCAPAVAASHIAAPVTSTAAAVIVNALRITSCPPESSKSKGSVSSIARTSSRAIRRTDDEDHGRQRKECHDGRNDELPARLRLLQPQIVPRRQRHLGAGLPRAAVPRVERHRREHRRREGGPALALRGQRTLDHEAVLTVRKD